MIKLSSLAGNKRGLAQFQKALENVKVRRTGKIQRGEPVLGYRVRNNRIRKGRPVPISAPSKAGVQMMSTAMPTAVQTQTTKRPNFSIKKVVKVEYNKPILSTANSAPEPIPLNAMNTDLFKSLPNIASQYQYYQFEDVTFNYVHSIDTQNPGLLGFGVAASSDTAHGCTTFDQMSGLSKYTTCNIFGNTTFSVNLQDFNQQFALQGCAIKPYEVTDDTDPQYTAGYLLLGEQNVTAALGTALGTLTISYRIRLLKEKVEQDPQGPTPITMTGAGFASNDWWPTIVDAHGALTWKHKSVTATRLSLSQLVLTFSDQRTYAIHLHVYAAGAAPSTDATVVGGTVLMHKRSTYATSGASDTWLFSSTRPGSTVTLANTGTVAIGVTLMIYPIKSHPACIAASAFGYRPVV